MNIGIQISERDFFFFFFLTLIQHVAPLPPMQRENGLITKGPELVVSLSPCIELEVGRIRLTGIWDLPGGNQLFWSLILSRKKSLNCGTPISRIWPTSTWQLNEKQQAARPRQLQIETSAGTPPAAFGHVAQILSYHRVGDLPCCIDVCLTTRESNSPAAGSSVRVVCIGVIQIPVSRTRRRVRSKMGRDRSSSRKTAAKRIFCCISPRQLAGRSRHQAGRRETAKADDA